MYEESLSETKAVKDISLYLNCLFKELHSHDNHHVSPQVSKLFIYRERVFMSDSLFDFTCPQYHLLRLQF